MKRLTPLVLVAALLFPSLSAEARNGRSSGGGSSPRLRFNDPVALTSFSPVRTAMSMFYSQGDAHGPSDHEWSAEPVIEVDDDGIIYIAGTCCVVASSPVWYSKDDGKTFEEMTSPGQVREWSLGAEGDLVVDHEGRVYFSDTYVPGLVTTRWSEHGDTWDFTVPAAGIIPGFDDRPWLAWTEKGIYQYINHVSHTQVYLSQDGGLTWTTKGPLEWKGEAGGQPYFPGHIAAHEKTGKLLVAGLHYKNLDEYARSFSEDLTRRVLGAAMSSDGGATFKEEEIATLKKGQGFSPIFTAVTAVDDAGNGYVAWSQYDKDSCEVYYSWSSDGVGWSQPIQVSTGSGCATFPWIDARDDGSLAVAWYQTTAPRKPKSDSSPDATRQPVLYGGIRLPVDPYQDDLPPDAEWYLDAALVSDASGSPEIISAQVPTETPVLLGPMARELWDFLQVDIGSDRRIHIAYAVKYKDSAPQTWYVSSRTAFPKANAGQAQ